MSTTSVDHAGDTKHEDGNRGNASDETDSRHDELPTFRVPALEGSTTVGLVEGADASLPGRVARLLERVTKIGGQPEVEQGVA